MERIQKWSRYIRILFQWVIIVIPIVTLVDWVIFDAAEIRMLQTFKFLEGANIMIPETIPYSTRWISFIIAMIPRGILMFIFYHLVKLFKLYEIGYIFTMDNIRHIKICAYATLVWLIAHFFEYILLILALTINNPKGSRYLSVRFGTACDFYSIIISIVIIIIAHVMDEARKIKNENELTI